MPSADKSFHKIRAMTPHYVTAHLQRSNSDAIVERVHITSNATKTRHNAPKESFLYVLLLLKTWLKSDNGGAQRASFGRIFIRQRNVFVHHIFISSARHTQQNYCLFLSVSLQFYDRSKSRASRFISVFCERFVLRFEHSCFVLQNAMS